MIKRLHQLQTETSPKRAETTPTEAEEVVEEEAGTFSKPLLQPESTLKRGPSPTRLLPGFVYQTSPSSAFRETEEGQGGRGGGRKRTVKENGEKAKQKLSCSSDPHTEEEEEEEQPSSNSWSEMSSMMIGSDCCLWPLSLVMEQRLLLQYLTPLGDYQEVRARTGSPEWLQPAKAFPFFPVVAGRLHADGHALAAHELRGEEPGQ